MTIARTYRPAVRDHTARLTVCVFCGARAGNAPAVERIADEVGSLIGQHGHDLVYGAGGTGLMGTVARSAMAAGAQVTGIVPRFLYEVEKADQAPVDEMLLTEDMFDRKREMIRRADAFIALPGGYGTLDEVLEVISLSYLGQCPKPLALVDVDGIWAPLLALFEDVRARGFVRQDAERLFRVVDSPADAVSFVRDHAPATVTAGRVSP